MNYRHGFHAGNFADVHKHVVLGALLDHLLQKPAAFCVLDTHAGRGAYDLAAAEAHRTGEFHDGVARLWHVDDAPPAVADWLARVRAYHHARGGGERPRFYPGSPHLVCSRLRADDRLLACERHPEELALLKIEFRGERRVAVHGRDGYEALQGLLPPAQKRGLVLIDPPYEPPVEEFARVRAALTTARTRFPQGIIALWYPIKDAAANQRWLRQVKALALGEVLACELCVWPDVKSERLSGSGMLVVNPPWQFAARMAAEQTWLLERLAREPGAREDIVQVSR